MIFESGLIYSDLSAAPSYCAPLMVDDRCRKNPTQPPTHRPDVS